MGGNTSKSAPDIKPPERYNVKVGNWSNYVKDSQTMNNYTESYLIGQEGKDPAPGCGKMFTTTYKCGNGPTKYTNVTAEARGKLAYLDCSKEQSNCSSYRLTLTDDGNLSFTKNGIAIWNSSTNKTGISVEKYKAKNSRYGRNYLESGEFLSIGEFIGSPSGNCYLMMTTSGLLLCYDVSGCDMSSSNVGYGSSEKSHAVYTIPTTNSSNNIGKRGYVTFGGSLKPFQEGFSGDDNVYFDLGNFNVTGHDIKSIGNMNADKCKEQCTSNDNCHGFFINNNGNCNLKDSGMYPNDLRIASDDGKLYVKSKRLDSAALTPILHQTTSSRWDLYPVGEKITNSTLTELGAMTQEEEHALAESKKELLKARDKVKQKINELSEQDSKISLKLQEATKNYKLHLDEFNPVNMETNSLKDAVKQLAALSSDSELLKESENTRYLIFSLLAVSVMVLGIRTLRR